MGRGKGRACHVESRKPEEGGKTRMQGVTGVRVGFDSCRQGACLNPLKLSTTPGLSERTNTLEVCVCAWSISSL